MCVSFIYNGHLFHVSKNINGQVSHAVQTLISEVTSENSAWRQQAGGEGGVLFSVRRQTHDKPTSRHIWSVHASVMLHLTP